MPVLLERLLAGSPRLSVLVTSRARLLVPFEWVFPVPGLCIAADDGAPGDAVELFLTRAAAAGSALTEADAGRVAAICRGLDGVALAIELTAARVPSLGLDGIEAGLADRMNLLAGGPRADDRHRSLRSALDWSYALLDEADRAVLRRISVFAAPFTATAAQAMLAGWPPAADGAIGAALARLADQSLLVAVADADGTRYRALETVRQYGAAQLDRAGEADQASARHLGWCLEAATALGTPDGAGHAWRSAFDQLADELRAALRWAAARAGRQPEAYRLAMALADLAFARGLPGESQRRYEQAAELAADAGQAAAALRWAAGAAKSRHFGNDALRLQLAAAEAAVRAGDRAGAAMDLAQAAEMCNRTPGLMTTLPPAGQARRAARPGAGAGRRERSGGGPVADRRGLQRRRHSIRSPPSSPSGPSSWPAGPVTRSRRARRWTSSPRSSWPAARSAPRWPARCGARSSSPRCARRRESALELSDALCMATECATAAGDLRIARQLAEQVRDLPFHREEGHLAAARLIVVATLAGDLDEALTLAGQFREGWERAGRPRAGNLTRSAYAAATVHGLRGEDTARTAWLDVVDALATPGLALSTMHFNEFFDACCCCTRAGRPRRWSC